VQNPVVVEEDRVKKSSLQLLSALTAEQLHGSAAAVTQSASGSRSLAFWCSCLSLP